MTAIKLSVKTLLLFLCVMGFSGCDKRTDNHNKKGGNSESFLYERTRDSIIGF